MLTELMKYNMQCLLTNTYFNKVQHLNNNN